MNNLSLKQGGGLKGSAAHMNAPPPPRAGCCVSSRNLKLQRFDYHNNLILLPLITVCICFLNYNCNGKNALTILEYKEQ